MGFLILLPALAVAAPAAEHVLVYEEKGRFGGWPANHGIWSWGDEILAGFSAAWHQVKDINRHQANSDKPEEPRLARSLDGGRTWKIETPAGLLPPEQGGRPAAELTEPLDFTNPNFAMTLRYTNIHTGPSRLHYSNDRGRTWRGTFNFPLFGQKGIAARTDYIVLGKRECLVFLTASKQNGREGRPLVVRTTDGGLTWKFLSWIGPEPKGFAIMPSSIRLSTGRIITTVRVKEDPPNWIDAYASDDNGATWTYLNRPAPDTGGSSGNPPSLLTLKDGRLALTYGYRSEPYSIRARLSRDQGKTWSGDITLRDGAPAWDLGYTRSIQRPDGKIVTVYYFMREKHAERFIAATIWEPK